MSHDSHSAAAAEDQVQTARVMAIDDPEAARGLLRKVIRSAEGSLAARDAQALLAEIDRRLPAGESLRDEDSEALRDRWLQLNGPTDGRLLPLLAEVTASTALLRSLQSVVEESLGTWIGATAAELELCAANPLAAEPAGLAAVASLVETASRVSRLEMVLRPEIDRFRQSDFACRLSQVAPQIERAVAEWQIDQARQLFEPIANPPAPLADHCFELQGRIDDAEQARLDTEQRLAALAGPPPASWSELRALLTATAAAAELAGEGALPKAFGQRLGADLDGARRRALQFLDEAAGELADLESIRRFWREVRRLEKALQAAGLQRDDAWLEKGVGHLESRWRQRVLDCGRVEELEAVALELEGALAPTPASVAEQGRRWLSELDRWVRVWRATQRGERCQQPDGDWVPEALAAAAAEHQQTLERLNEGFRALEASPSGAPRAAEIAELVLQQHPNHSEALRLRQAAGSLQLKQELDVALRSWAVDRFRDLAQQAATPDAYRALLAKEAALQTIAGLARAPALAHSAAAARWWRRLAKARDRLPASRPAAVDEGLRELLRRRQDQWRALLDEQLDQELPAHQWRDLLRQLEGVAGHQDLDLGGELARYREEFQRRCQLAEVEQHLGEGRWQEAASELESVAGEDERKRRLSLRLAIEHPLAERLWPRLAQALHRWWGAAIEAYGARALEILEGALAGAWRAGDREALEVLRRVAQRARRAPEAVVDAGRRIAAWLAWLQLEDECRDGLPVGAASRLASHLEGCDDEERHELAGSLVSAWRQRGQDVSLAWLFRAFPGLRGRLFPDLIDPGSVLERRGSELAADIHAKLHTEDGPDSEELEELIRRLSGIEEQLGELEHLRQALPYTTDPLAPPAQLLDAGRQLRALEQLRQGTQRLLGSDLREGKGALDALRHLAVQQLRGLPLQRPLLAELDRLAPLTRLWFQEAELHRAAERCGDGDLDRPGVFEELAQKVRLIDEEIAQAGLTGAVVEVAVVEQYRTEIAALAGDLGAPAEAADLTTLAAHFSGLGRNEEALRKAIADLEREEPFVGIQGHFDPDRHREYLRLFPATAPASRRALRLFDRFAQLGQRRAVLERSVDAGLLPGWIENYLRQGAP